MSILFYLTSYVPLPERKEPSRIFTMREFQEMGYSYKDIKKLYDEFPIDWDNLSDDDEIFYAEFEDTEKLSFEVVLDDDPSTITAYRKARYYYQIKVLEWDKFYQDLASYLNEAQVSLEIWKLWDDQEEQAKQVDLKDIVPIELWEINAESLEKALGGIDFLQPVVVAVRM